VVKNFGRALMLFKSEISGETLSLSPVTAQNEARQRAREDERDRSLTCESTGLGDMRKGMGFGFSGTSRRKLLKLLAEDGEKMPKARRHGSFIYVNVCHRFFREAGENR